MHAQTPTIANWRRISAAVTTAIALLLALLPTTTAQAQEAVSTFTIAYADDGGVFTFDASGATILVNFPDGETREYSQDVGYFDLRLIDGVGASGPALEFTWGVDGGPIVTETFQASDPTTNFAAGSAFIGAAAGQYSIVSNLGADCSGPAEFEILELELDPVTGDALRAAIDYWDTCFSTRASIRLDSAVPLDTAPVISGTVTDEETGALLGDVVVCTFTDNPDDESFCDTTNMIGRYTISDIPEGFYGVEFSDYTGRGYAGECYPADYICDSAIGLTKTDFINVASAINASLKRGCLRALATIVGTEGPDDLVGTTGDDVFIGLGGDDTITGLGGNDVVCGGAGNDEVELGAGDDAVLSGPGADAINAGDGANIVISGAGVDVITTGAGDDLVYAEGGSDRIETGGGADTIYAGGGNDRVDAGAGIDIIYGQPGADTLRGGADADEIYGGPGYDTLWGDGGDDFLNAGGGNDTIWGGGGADKLYGKPGDDTMYGESGFDEMYGAGGDDTMIGGQGNDRIQGAAGNDTLEGRTGNDTLYGQAGNDTMSGNDGNDTLYAAAGDDTLDGGPGDDNLQAGGGDDVLDGGPGADTLYGQPGLNSLDGGPDTDECYAGGPGSTVIGCE